MNRREVITRKSQFPFYAQCFGRFGYAVHSVRKDGHNQIISFERKGPPLSDTERAALRYTEEKLRAAEIISRKQAGYHSLYFNLLLHILLFCLQGYILNQLRIDKAHPRQMLGVGVILFAVILLAGLLAKITEYLRWSKTIRQIKEELLRPLDEIVAEKADSTLLAEVERQAAVYTPPQTEGGYTPSEDTVRLTNAINRGLEKPEHPEEVVALIMQGISARYACFPTQMTSADLLRLIREKNYNQAIQYITITADSAVKVTFM